MLTKRRMSILALVLVAVMCLALVACQTTTGKTGTATATATATTTAAGNRPAGVPADYPAKNIDCMYAFSAGGTTESYVRQMFASVEKAEGFKNKFVITFHEGAGGKIGWSAIANGNPDGYTIGILNSPMLGLAIAEAPQPFGVGKFVHIYGMMVDPGCVGAGKDTKYTSLKEIIDAATAKPGQISVGDTGLTTSESRAIHMFEAKAGNGCKFNIVPFDGANEAVVAVRGGHVDTFCLNVGDIANNIKAGDVKVFAVGTTERYADLPDVQTYKEAGYDVWQYSGRSLGAPIGFPAAIRDYLENCFMTAAKTPEMVKAGKDLGLPILPWTGKQVEASWAEQDASLQALWKTAPWQ